ncbi:MAG: response regulator, partial [Caldimonas sp.]
MFHRSIEKPRSPRATRRETLLVVDDQAANIQVLYRALSAHYEIFMALSGTQAIAMCRDNPPDLVLLDVVMPEIDGYQVCQRLKAAASTRDIPIIFVTANDDPLEEARGLELGAVDFITKPVSPAVVRARVRTHLELARARLQLTATLEATADGILVTDLDGFIGTLNRRFADMWDMPHDLLEREGSASVAAHMRALRVLPAGSAAAEAAKEPPGEFMDIEVEGGRHYERHTRPLQSNGRLQGHVYSFRDVTQQRKDALALTRFNEVLEARIRERTQELEQARQVADAANMAKSNLLSNMSHELRTPLNSILGMAHLALKRELDDPTREYLRKMSRSGEHLLRLLNDVLDFARLDAGKLELELTDFTLGSLFDEIAGQLVSAAENKGLELTFRIDPALRRSMRGDVHRLKQVLLNYVGNAIKFSDSGRISVQARLEAHDDSGATLRFDVQDQGIGIASEQVGSLFQSFHQADASDTRKYDGAGLGLAIAKRLASKMNGEVGVDSRLGAGSLFWLRVTLGWGHASSIADSGTSAPADLDTPGLQGHTILVVDDNSFNRLVATDLLLAAGAKTFVAANGQEALDMLAKHSFACVLMDVQMPVMDGLEATRRIRADPALRAVRIVAMTANVRTENRLECLAAGMDDFLTKPVIPDL